MNEYEVVIVLNPGSTSTKFGLYNRQGPVFVKTVRHKAEDLNRFGLVTEQLDFRYRTVFHTLQKEIKTRELVVVGVVGRGGIVKPVEGGTYRVNEAFLEDARSGRYGNHASNLGTLLADRFRMLYGGSCFRGQYVGQSPGVGSSGYCEGLSRSSAECETYRPDHSGEDREKTERMPFCGGPSRRRLFHYGGGEGDDP